jgi:glucokinase
MEWVIGIDIGGTNCVGGAVAVDGSRAIATVTQPTLASQGAGAVVADLAAMTARIAADVRADDAAAHILGVGVGAPGPLDLKRGVVLLTPNLGWTDVPLRDMMADATGLEVALENDANCAVLAETWVGAARGGRWVIGLTLGTGIGGAIVNEGKLHRGASDAAGEFGHMVIDLNGPLCGCGNRGCLEALASGRNIARRAQQLIRCGRPSRLADLVEGHVDEITAELVYRAAAEGDEMSQQVTADTARFLGIGVANYVNIFNPDIVVILGGVAAAGDALFTPLRAQVAERAFRSMVEVCRIVPGALGGLAGVYGAARAFLDQRAGNA